MISIVVASFTGKDRCSSANTLRFPGKQSFAALFQNTSRVTRRPVFAMSDFDPTVLLFTDGACKGNPGPGGWAYLLRHPESGAEKEGSGGHPETTNNQMELQAVISGLEALKRATCVEVVTDSTYVADGASKWIAGWKKNGWRRREGRNFKPLKNCEYWQRIDELLTLHDVRFRVVRGHSGHPENERCDELAVEAAARAQRGD